MLHARSADHILGYFVLRAYANRVKLTNELSGCHGTSRLIVTRQSSPLLGDPIGVVAVDGSASSYNSSVIAAYVIEIRHHAVVTQCLTHFADS